MSESRGVLSVGELARDRRLTVRLDLVAGKSGLDRPIRHPRIQKSGLALAGHFFGVVPTRVQVLGETELSFLDGLTTDKRKQAAQGFFSLGLSCVTLTRHREPDECLLQAANEAGTALFVSDSRSSRTINALHAVLDDHLAPTTRLHGVLVDVFGVGILLLGKSGIGKSECAMELILRGHRLVADDVVHCDWRPPGIVFGEPVDLLRHHIETRGLGVLNVKALFGVTAVRERKRIDLVIRLVEWAEGEPYDRLGTADAWFDLLGTPIRELTVPVRPGRDMGSILEVAARNELLRRAGTDSAREFLNAVERQLVTSEALEAIPESELSPDRTNVRGGLSRQPEAHSEPSRSVYRPESPVPMPSSSNILRAAEHLGAAGHRPDPLATPPKPPSTRRGD